MPRVVDFLASTQPPATSAPSPWTETAPPDHVAWNSDKTIGLAWSSLPNSYRSPFCAALGFEIALVYGQSVRLSDITAELRRLVTQHDSAGTDLLVVSVNVSFRSGLYFPSAKLLADMIFSAPLPLAGWAPANLARIVLHDPEKPGRARWLLGNDVR